MSSHESLWFSSRKEMRRHAETCGSTICSTKSTYFLRWYKPQVQLYDVYNDSSRNHIDPNETNEKNKRTKMHLHHISYIIILALLFTIVVVKVLEALHLDHIIDILVLVITIIVVKFLETSWYHAAARTNGLQTETLR